MHRTERQHGTPARNAGTERRAGAMRSGDALGGLFGATA